MTGTGRHLWWQAAIPALLLLTSSIRAQLPVPLLHSVFPPGAQAGTTVEVTIRGVFLEGASALVLSDDALGITCEAIVDEAMPDYTSRFRLAIPAGAAPGTYDLFAKCALGLSTPRPFVISAKPELVESTDNVLRDHPMLLERETVVNGCADENANNYYRIDAQAGEKLVVTCRAENLDSRMDATLVLYDETGRELDRDRNNRDRNAVVALSAPRDGSYFLHVADFTFGGGHTYPYRLTLTAAPHLSFVFPPAGQPGTTGRFTLYGRNLPGSNPADRVLVGNRLLETQEVEISLPAAGAFTRSHGETRSAFLRHIPYRLESGSLKSNPLPIGIAHSPGVVEQEDFQAPPRQVTLPCEIHGRFDHARDQDQFRFSASKDQQLWIEVIAERMGASVDPNIRIERVTTSEDGAEQFQPVGNGDDLGNDPGERYFPLPCRDAEMTVKIPEDGTYQVTIMNQIGSGGNDQVYRLILREPRPGFDLVAIPWEPFRVRNQVECLTSIVRPGGSTELRILALRHEGFDGEIELHVEGLPPGVTCPPVKMGGGKSTTITLVAAPATPRWDGIIRIRGVSEDLERDARLGSVPWPVNDWSKQYFETRLGPGIPLSVTDAEKAAVTIVPPESRRIEMTMGENIELPVRIVRNIPNTGNFVLRPVGLPHKTGELTISSGAEEGTLMIASGKEGEFPRERGSWTFHIRAEGTIKYEPSKATALHARARHRLLVERKRAHADILAKLEGERDEVLGAVEKLERAAEGNAPGGNEELQSLRSQLDAAEGNVHAAHETAASLQAAVLRAAAEAKSAADLVKTRDARVVSYSAPITITVAPASKEDEQAP